MSLSLLVSPSFIGSIVLLAAALSLGKWIYVTFVRKVDLEKYKRNGQGWAVITGSTDGIGLAFAEELAQQNFHLLLVSRNKDKLEQVKKNISGSNKKIKVDYVVSDANDISAANIDAVVAKAKSCGEIAILVNNVGIGQGGKALTHLLSAEAIEECIRVNCTFPSLLTRAMIPLLRARPDAARTAIINIASVAGLAYSPFSSIYGATKAFNRSFSMSLSAEYCHEGIDVVAINPGFVVSNLTKMQESWICCSARSCAEYSLKRIQDVDVIPHPIHTSMYALMYVICCIPASLASHMMNFVISKSKAIRNIDIKTE